MTAPTCDVSWLRLEQYLLGELPGAAGDHVAEQLASCAHCQAMRAEIEGDERALPELPSLSGLSEPALVEPGGDLAQPDRVEASGSLWTKLRGLLGPWGLVPVLVAAVALVLVLPLGDQERVEEHPGWPPSEVHIKGGNLAIRTVAEPEGERFQVRVTCPPGTEGLDLVAIEDRSPSFPLEMPRCGNGVVAGAITADRPERTKLCVVQGVSREDFQRLGIVAIQTAEAAACTNLSR